MAQKKFTDQQIQVLREEISENPHKSQRSLAAQIKDDYFFTFEGRTYASIYGALRRLQRQLKTVVAQATTSANASADTVGA